MASLVEELIDVLEAEEKIYVGLKDSGERKREVLIQADVAGLEKITAQEQLAGDELISHSNHQIRLLGDIANVLGKKDGDMTVTKLISLLDSQPDVQKKLTEVRDRLVERANEVKQLNDENTILIEQAIELNEFDLTLFRSLRQAPETANYDRSAYNTGTILGSSGFDATS